MVEAVPTEAVPQGRARPAMRWAAGGAALLLFAVATTTSADPDLWGHLRFGLDTARTLTLTTVDPYSFTQDRPWINHEWLSELLMALPYLAAGTAGLTLLKGSLVVAALGAVWASLGGLGLAARMVVLGVVAVGTSPITSTLRPQLWTLLFLVLLCRMLASGQPRALRWVPPLFAAWANLHGGWIVGLGVLAVWMAVDVCVEHDRAIGRVLVVVASAAATLLTPYGLSLWTFVWHTVHLTRDIAEWQPLARSPLVDWFPWGCAIAVSLAATRRPHRYRWHVATVAAMLAYAAFHVIRIGPLFVACAATLSGPPLSRWLAPTPARGPAPNARLEQSVALCLVALAVTSSTWVMRSSLRCIDVHGPWMPPANAGQLLAGASAGRVVTFFDWGEYAIWHLGPRLTVSMDGRRETVYTDSRLAEHDAILAGLPDGLRALASWRAEYVWLPARSQATKRWLAANGYRIELDDAASFVAVRSDLAPLPQGPGPHDPRCFPD